MVTVSVAVTVIVVLSDGNGNKHGKWNLQFKQVTRLQ